MLKRMGLGQRIIQRMAELGIRTNVELAEKMGGKVHANSVGKWISGRSTPRGNNLITLAKALQISVELLAIDEGDNPDKIKSLERMVSAIVQSEIQKSIPVATNEFDEMMKCEKVPAEDKASIVRQIKNLLKQYRDS